MSAPRDRNRSTSALDRADLRELAERRDPLGVLSVYVDADPRAKAIGQPAWTIALDDRLRELSDRVKRDAPRERWVALRATLERVDELLRRPADAAAPGRARVLFASLSDDWTAFGTFQLNGSTEVILDQGPRIRPLIRLVRDGAPGGAALVSEDGVEWLEMRLGHLERLGIRGFSGAAAGARENRGPAGDRPGRGARGATPADRAARRWDDGRVRFLTSAAEELREVAVTRGWSEVLLLGEPRLVEMVGAAPEGGPAAPHVAIARLDASRLSDAELAEWLRGEFAELRSRRRLDRVASLAQAAAQGGRATTSLPDVLDALTAGRVEALLYDERVALTGTRLPDGRLLPYGQGGAEIGATEEPLLVERMIEVALATDAEVLPLSAPEAEGLDDGVAATLRR